MAKFGLMAVLSSMERKKSHVDLLTCSVRRADRGQTLTSHPIGSTLTVYGLS